MVTPPKSANKSDSGHSGLQHTSSSSNTDTSEEIAPQPSQEIIKQDSMVADGKNICNDTDASSTKVDVKQSTMKKLTKQVKNSTSALKKVAKKSIQKKGVKTNLDTKLKTLKKTNKLLPGKMKRPPREVFVTNPNTKVQQESPFKKPKFGPEALTASAGPSTSNSLDSNRQLLESITMAGRRQRRASSSSSTISSTSDSAAATRPRSRSRHGSSSSHASDSSVTTKRASNSSGGGGGSSKNVAATGGRLTGSKGKVSLDVKSDVGDTIEESPVEQGMPKKSESSSKLAAKPAKVLKKAKKKLFQSTQKLVKGKIGTAEEKSATTKPTNSNDAAAKKESESVESCKNTVASKPKDSVVGKKQIKKSPTKKAVGSAKKTSPKLVKGKGLKRKASSTSLGKGAVQPSKKSKASTKDDDDEIMLRSGDGRKGQEEGKTAADDDDTDVEADTVHGDDGDGEGMVHVQVDEEISLFLSDSTYNEFQKIETNGPSPVKKTKAKAGKSGTAAETGGSGAAKKADREADAGALTTPATGKKKKKKVVTAGSTGLRKGRSGANTRSTNIHL